MVRFVLEHCFDLVVEVDVGPVVEILARARDVEGHAQDVVVLRDDARPEFGRQRAVHADHVDQDLPVDRARQPVRQLHDLDALPVLVRLDHALAQRDRALARPLLQRVAVPAERLDDQHALGAVDAHLHGRGHVLLRVVLLVQHHALELLRRDPAAAVGLVGAVAVHDVLLARDDVLLLDLAAEDARGRVEPERARELGHVLVLADVVAQDAQHARLLALLHGLEPAAAQLAVGLVEHGLLDVEEVDRVEVAPEERLHVHALHVAAGLVLLDDVHVQDVVHVAELVEQVVLRHQLRRAHLEVVRVQVDREHLLELEFVAALGHLLVQLQALLVGHLEVVELLAQVFHAHAPHGEELQEVLRVLPLDDLRDQVLVELLDCDLVVRQQVFQLHDRVEHELARLGALVAELVLLEPELVQRGLDPDDRADLRVLRQDRLLGVAVVLVRVHLLQVFLAVDVALDAVVGLEHDGDRVVLEELLQVQECVFAVVVELQDELELVHVERDQLERLELDVLQLLALLALDLVAPLLRELADVQHEVARLLVVVVLEGVEALLARRQVVEGRHVVQLEEQLLALVLLVIVLVDRAAECVEAEVDREVLGHFFELAGVFAGGAVLLHQAAVAPVVDLGFRVVDEGDAELLLLEVDVHHDVGRLVLGRGVVGVPEVLQEQVFVQDVAEPDGLEHLAVRELVAEQDQVFGLGFRHAVDFLVPVVLQNPVPERRHRDFVDDRHFELELLYLAVVAALVGFEPGQFFFVELGLFVVEELGPAPAVYLVLRAAGVAALRRLRDVHDRDQLVLVVHALDEHVEVEVFLGRVAVVVDFFFLHYEQVEEQLVVAAHARGFDAGVVGRDVRVGVLGVPGAVSVVLLVISAVMNLLISLLVFICGLAVAAVFVEVRHFGILELKVVQQLGFFETFVT